MNKNLVPTIRLTGHERKVLREKLDAFSMVEMIEAAIEEVEELRDNLELAKKAWENGDMRGFAEVINAAGEEYADVQVTVGDTLHMIFPEWFLRSVLEKRIRVYEVQLPEHIRNAKNKVNP